MGWKEMVPLIGPGLEFLGGEMTRRGMASNAARDRAMQREFAQYGIRWKVADARAAGINPLVALGASTFNARPVSVGEQGRGFSRMGQAISRLDFASRHIDNEYKMAMTENIRADTKVKLQGQPDGDVNPLGVVTKDNVTGPGVRFVDSKVEKSKAHGLQAGSPSAYRHYQRPDGAMVMSISEAASEPMESDWFAKLQNMTYRIGAELKWHVRFNKGDVSILAEIKRQRPTESAGRGKEWRYSLKEGAWFRGKRLGRVLVDREHYSLHDKNLRKFNRRALRRDYSSRRGYYKTHR